jgi:hypothetical protein
MNYKEELVQLLSANSEMMSELAAVRRLQLPDWCIAAGYVRNYIWDSLHGYTTRTPLNDIDVIYYDKENTDEASEKRYEQQLRHDTANPLWSVKNQARMHVRNGAEPYLSVQDAMRRWPETVTAVGVRLEEDDRLTVIGPHGLDDIFEFRVRKSPLFDDAAYYRHRVSSKNWKQLWPKLTIE